MKILLSVVAFALLLAGCQPAPRGGAGSTVSNTNPVFRIGYQKGGALHLLRVNGALDKRLAPQNVRVEWVQFTAAPPMLEAIGVGSLDVGSGGDAPVVFAQAAGYPIVLLANTPPGDSNSRAVIVAQNSPLRSLADLKGKRVALSKGTGTHNFFLQVLEKAGVAYADIKPVYLSPPDARAAFDSGRVDAWAAWDPYLTVAVEATKAKVLVNGGNIVSAGGFYFSSRAFARQHPDWIRAALEEVDKAGVSLWKNPREAAQILSPHLGVSVETLTAMNRNAARGERYVGFQPINPSIVKAQQTVADNFFRIGLLPQKVDVKQTLLTPQEYARLLPAQRVTLR